MHLAAAAKFPELLEHQLDRARHALVRIDLDASARAPAIARRQGEPKLAALGLRVSGSQATLSQKAELVFAHRTLQPKQQPVVDQTRIVGPVQIDNQRAGQGAQVYQMMPVPSVPGEPGSLDAEHRADRAGAHRSGKLLESRAFRGPGARTAEIVVDDRHRREPGVARRVDQLVLPPLALVFSRTCARLDWRM